MRLRTFCTDCLERTSAHDASDPNAEIGESN
jgi:hypothetical protein